MASGSAKRYAQAVVSLAKEQGSFDAWQADLGRLGELMDNPDAAAFLTSPGVPNAEKLTMLDTVLEGAQPEARNLVHMLVERRRVEIIPEMVRLFNDAVLAERGIAIAEVTTAEPLGPEEQEAVKAQLKRITGKDIELRLHEDPAIIGGIIARVGDQLIDGSVVNQLRRLRARIAAA